MTSTTPNGVAGGVKIIRMQDILKISIVMLLPLLLIFLFLFCDESRLLSKISAMPPAVAAAAAAAARYGGGKSGPIIFNFGDSNSDTGGLAAAMGYRLSPPESRLFFGHPTGRFSDGRLVIDFLCEKLNTHHLSAYLKALGADFSNGANFAIAGSTTLPRDVPFALHLQVQQFVYFKARSLELINEGANANGLINEQGFGNALYIIDIGQNDVNALLGSLPLDQVLAELAPILAEIKEAIQTLYKNGGRNFWIHGTGALGCLPQKLAMPTNDASDLDENGCLKTYNNVAKTFNAKLSSICDELGLRLKDATIVFVDMFAIKYDLVASHNKYGFTYPLMACCGYGGPPHNYNPNVSCLAVGSKACDDGSMFISWDGVHLTEAANAVIAAKLFTGEFSKPKLKFDYFMQSLI